MKKFSKLFMVLALALVLVFAAKGLDVKADTTTSGSGSSVSGSTVDVNEATLKVTVKGEGNTTNQLYYQVVKDEAAIAKIKAANWIPAVANGNDFYIDLSAYTKAVVVAYTFDPTDEKKASAGSYKVDMPTAKLKVKVNFKTDVVVDPDALGYNASSNSGCELKDIVTIEGGADTLTYQYRRSTGEEWMNDGASKTDLFKTYSMLRASNGTLYIRAYTTATPGLATKEVKVKIPKGASAPKIKVDYVKGVVKFPKSCEIKGVSAISGDELDKYFYATENGLTHTKGDAKADVPVDKLIAGMSADSGGKVSFIVRTQATDKKFASFFAKVEFVVPAEAPIVESVIYDAAAKKVTVSISGGATDAVYQYEKSEGKWAELKDNAFKATSKPTTVKIRIAPVKETKDKVGVFGSEVATETAKENLKVTFKATVSATSGSTTVEATDAMKVTVKVDNKDVTADGVTVVEGKKVTYTVEIATSVTGYTAPTKIKVDSVEKTLENGKVTIETDAINAAKEIKIEVVYTKQ